VTDEVRAAGGVVVRRSGDGRLEVAVVHRPRYDDWSLPKGKLEEGESFSAAAAREVEEETGLRCELREELEPSRYRDQRGREKLVRWWRMEPVAGKFAPNSEVDELRWLTPDAALRLLAYAHDRRLLESIAESAPSDKRPGR
jgi:8-oxo-dGTP diphosphatase